MHCVCLDNMSELAGNETPREGEDSFFCLMENDNQVSHFSVETDTLLDAPTKEDTDNAKVHMVVTVELRAYSCNEFQSEPRWFLGGTIFLNALKPFARFIRTKIPSSFLEPLGLFFIIQFLSRPSLWGHIYE